MAYQDKKLHLLINTLKKRWAGETVAIVATGPSITSDDIALLYSLNLKIIAVSNSWELCPFADILYAADCAWWRDNNYVSGFKGERWSQQQGPKEWPAEAERNNINIVVSKNLPGISIDPTVIHTGFNSSFQALNIAVLQGAKQILLLGVDCAILNGKRHWFGDHPGKLNRPSPYDLFIKAFNSASPTLKNLGVDVINCSEQSALTCFKKANLVDLL